MQSIDEIVTDEMVETLASILRRALVDAAHVYRADKAKCSAMFAAETIVSNHARSALEAALSAIDLDKVRRETWEAATKADGGEEIALLREAAETALGSLKALGAENGHASQALRTALSRGKDG